MKKLFPAAIVVLMSLSILCACGNKEEEVTQKKFSDMNYDQLELNLSLPENITNLLKPDVKQIKNICVLATNKVYFHNIAKATKEKGSGINSLLKEDRRFWFEYSGTAEIGIDMSEVQMTIEGDRIIVTMPHSKLLSDIEIDSKSYTIDSIVAESDAWAKTNNSITAADVTAAINRANNDMKNKIANDKSLMVSADQKAQDLIENYIEKFSAKSKINYQVEFHYTDELPGSIT